MAFGTCSGTAGQTGCAPRGSRRAFEIAGIVLGVFYFWPLAVAYVGWKLLGYPVPPAWRERLQEGLDRAGFGGGARPAWSQGFTGAAPTGNRAFDDYRRGEIERLEAERRRLDDDAREFRTFVDDLKRAKDREEFDAYMARRRKA